LMRWMLKRSGEGSTGAAPMMMGVMVGGGGWWLVAGCW